jgi:hypothetical protein
MLKFLAVLFFILTILNLPMFLLYDGGYMINNYQDDIKEGGFKHAFVFFTMPYLGESSK